MKREILFRGQTRRKGDKVNMAHEPLPSRWVYGGIFYTQNAYSVIYDYDTVEKYPVYSETVGQYTGMTDRNGVKIFEGDIVKTSYFGAEDGRSINHAGFDLFEVNFFNGGFHIENKRRLFNLRPGVEMEVVGNIYDNPELTEKVEKKKGQA